jgi:hypothetical protein
MPSINRNQKDTLIVPYETEITEIQESTREHYRGLEGVGCLRATLLYSGRTSGISPVTSLLYPNLFSTSISERKDYPLSKCPVPLFAIKDSGLSAAIRCNLLYGFIAEVFVSEPRLAT